MPTIIEVSGSLVRVIVTSNTDARIFADLAEIKGMIMSQSGQIHATTLLVEAFASDALSKIERIEDALRNPDDSSQLSDAALGELASLRNVLTAARAAGGIDESGAAADPVPATDGAATGDAAAVEPVAGE